MRLSYRRGFVGAVFAAAFLFLLTAEGALAVSTIYLRPNADRVTSKPWTVVGATKAWEALDDSVDYTEIPDVSSPKYITANPTAFSPSARTTEVELGTASLSGKMIIGAKAWVYSSTSTKFTMEVVSGSSQIASESFEGVGWHALPLAFTGEQSQIDQTYIRFVAGGGVEFGLRELRAAFVEMTLEPATAISITRLRPDSSVVSEWSITGAPSAWQALDDPVNEMETPTSADYISANPTPTGGAITELGLQTQSLSGHSIVEASAWFYTPNANSVIVEAKSQGASLAKGRFASVGWHALPISMNQSQGQLDVLQLRFSSDFGTLNARQINAAFLRFSVRIQPKSIYWGARIDGEVYSNPNDAPWDSGVWNTFEEHTGKKVSIVHYGQQPPWELKNQFDREPFDKAGERNAISLLSMGTGLINPAGPHIKSNEIPLTWIIEGKYDEAIRSWAKKVAEYKTPLFFRWGWEMNGQWYRWGEEAAANPSLYIQAWRRFHRIADEQKASNITWVWCPNVSFPGSTSLASLYPGNDYVDWLCMDGYNKDIGANWRSFESLFAQTYGELLSIAPSKPIMIGETASTEEAGTTKKATWITEALSSLPTVFPAVRAYVWFNWNITEEGVERQWPIETSASSQSAFATGISSSYYSLPVLSSLPLLSPIQPLP